MGRVLKVAYYGSNGHQISYAVAKTSHVRLTGVSGIPKESFEKLKSEMPDAYRHAKWFETLEAMLAGAGAEMVSICSPRRDGQHEDIVKALDAGAHVYAEKPLAASAEGLDAVRAAAARSGRQVRVMTGMIYAPIYRSMRELVASGRLGTVVQVFAQKSYPYHDRRPKDRGIDGGIILQASIHAVSFVRYVTGLEFEEVFAMDTGTGNPKKGDLQMAAQYIARLSGGALCTIACNYCNPQGIGFWGNDQLRVFGTEGMAESVDGGTRTLLAIGKEKPCPLPCETEKAAIPDPLFQDYVDHLLNGKPMLLSQEDSFANTLIVLKAQQSADSGRPVRVI
ncbi:MAG: Gfo/Idh/MocA family oxidoreductase [Planctomycetota bacterium]|nr:Gfo/Idh/MocA family oxidoreductase [Planctomycetota bacterium]